MAEAKLGFYTKRIARPIGATARKDGQTNNLGRERAIELSRLGWGTKAIRAAMPGVTVRRIRRWRIEAGMPTQVSTVKDSRGRGKNIDKQLAARWKDERRAFLKGDESTHWSNHPEIKNHHRAPEVRKQRQRDYYKKNSKRIWARVMSNPQQKLRRVLRTRIYAVLRGLKKSAPTMELVGCSRDFLVRWLEGKWKPGMSWDNHGINGWHIDHIIPCASFDLRDPEQQRKCFHYTNLQPLWAFENWSKKDRIPSNHQPQLTISL